MEKDRKRRQGQGELVINCFGRGGGGKGVLKEKEVLRMTLAGTWGRVLEP